MVDELDFLKDDQPQPKKQGTIFTPGTIVLIVGFLSVMLVLGVQLFRQNQVQPVPGTIAPDFTITSYEGETYNLSDLRGTIVILNFWANWCAPCHAEADDLQDIYEEYQDDGVLLIGANYLEIERVARAFVDQYRLTYPNGPDVEQSISEAYNFQGPPETFVIDRDGRIAAVFIGAVSYDRLAAEIEALLEADS